MAARARIGILNRMHIAPVAAEEVKKSLIYGYHTIFKMQGIKKDSSDIFTVIGHSGKLEGVLGRLIIISPFLRLLMYNAKRLFD